MRNHAARRPLWSYPHRTLADTHDARHAVPYPRRHRAPDRAGRGRPGGPDAAPRAGGRAAVRPVRSRRPGALPANLARGPPRRARPAARRPNAAGREGAAVPDAPSAAALTGLRVLVVEDEFLIALELSSILDDLGCIVLGLVASVPEALRLLAAEPPDITLLDINLNGTRTTPVALALAADGLPFIAVTAYANLPEPVFDGVPIIGKPFWPEQVRDALLGLARP